MDPTPPPPGSGGTEDHWTAHLALATIDGRGGTEDVTIRVGRPDRARIMLVDGDTAIEFSGADYRDCLTRVRRTLESQGRLLCCQGARPLVHASGLPAQFSNGREAYANGEPRAEGEPPAVVDIFAPAPPGSVTTLDDQRRRLLRFLGMAEPGPG